VYPTHIFHLHSPTIEGCPILRYFSSEGWESTNLNRPFPWNGDILAVDCLAGTQSIAIRSRPRQLHPSRSAGSRLSHPYFSSSFPHHRGVPHPSLFSSEGWESTTLNRPFPFNGDLLAVDSLAETLSIAIRSRPLLVFWLLSQTALLCPVKQNDVARDRGCASHEIAS
jgi:hypothetical protein